MTKNDLLSLEITGMTLQGDGIARCGGVPVFVPGVCPGDRVNVLIIKAKPSYAVGKCLEVLSPSPQRIDPECEAFPRCGGCAFRCMGYEAELALKGRESAEILRRIGNIDLAPEPILGAPAQARYRNKALLPLRVQDGRVYGGFYARHSHRVIPCADCRLQPEIFARLTELVCRWAEETRCSVYDEATGRGLLRHLYLRQTQNCAQVLVCLVINGSKLPQAEQLLPRLRAFDCVKGVLLNHNTRPTNVVLGEKETLLWGERHIFERLCGLEFALSPLSFFQVNPAQAQGLYRLAGEFAGLQGGERLLDLYCGTGTIGLSLAGQCAELVGVEVIPQAVEDARRNAQHNGIANARFLCGGAAQAAAQLAEEGWRPDVALMDPPRKGCEPQLLHTLAGMQPRRVVYISCDPATLARDLGVMQGLGYVVTRLRPVDMFPRTGHVECVALLERRSFS